MLPIVSLVVGAALGWFRASRRGGALSDKLQYAVGYGFAFGLAGFALAILIVRAGLF